MAAKNNILWSFVANNYQYKERTQAEASPLVPSFLLLLLLFFSFFVLMFFLFFLWLFRSCCPRLILWLHFCF